MFPLLRLKCQNYPIKLKKKVVRLTLCPSDQIVSSVEQPMKGEDLDGKHEKVIC